MGIKVHILNHKKYLKKENSITNAGVEAHYKDGTIMGKMSPVIDL